MRISTNLALITPPNLEKEAELNIPAQLGDFSSERRKLFLLDNLTPTFANFILFKTNFFIQNVK